MNQAGPQQTIAQQMHAGPDVGQALRARREELGWSLAEVAGWLRIKLAYLEALEDGRPQDLPGSTYALGFLRSYASGLGLDAEELARRFRDETKGIARPDLRFPAPVPERGVPAGAAVLLGVVLMGAAYTGWYMFGDHEKLPMQTVPPPPVMAPQPLAQQPSAPQASAPQAPGSQDLASRHVAQAGPPAAIAPAPAAPPGTPDNAAPAVPQAAASGIPQAAAPGGQAVLGGTPTAAPLPTITSAEPVGSSPPGVTPAVPDPDTLTIKASAASWVQVRKAGGPVIYEHILQAGESWSAPAGNADLLLSTGNAGAVTVSAGAATTPALGRFGAVRRNLRLSVSSVRDGSLVASPPVGSPSVGSPSVGSPSGQTAPILAGSGARKTPAHTMQPQSGPPSGDENDLGQDGGQSNPEH